MPVMTERTELLSYLFYGPCSAVLINNTIKNSGSNIFYTSAYQLGRAMAFFVAHATFSSSEAALLLVST